MKASSDTIQIGGGAMLLVPGTVAVLHAIGPEPGAALPYVFFAGLGLALFSIGRKFAS